jgi:hypothetical protein
MTHTRVKVQYETQGPYGSTEMEWLYCHHNHTCDFVTFYNDDGSYADMIFGEWGEIDKWRATELLMYYHRHHKDGKTYGEFTKESGIEWWTPEDRERLK